MDVDTPRKLNFDECTNTPKKKPRPTQSSISTSLEVFLRIRPKTKHKPCTAKYTVSNDNKSIELTSPNQSDIRNYTFNYIFDQITANSQVSDKIGNIAIDRFLSGYSNLIFSYGITGSGKTHTIMGTNNVYNGLIPSILTGLFNHKLIKNNTKEKLNIFCSYMENYSKDVYDLLSNNISQTNKLQGLQIRVLPSGADIPDLTTRQVTNTTEALQLIQFGNRKRSKAHTKLNTNSSRSHALFILDLFDNNNNLKSQLCIVDLAGSESVKRTGFNPSDIRFNESCEINTSLSVLSRCIESIQNKNANVPWREVTLTKILYQYLCGKGYVSMIVNAHITDDDYNETMRALEFGSNSQNITMNPIVNSVRASTRHKSRICVSDGLMSNSTYVQMSTHINFINSLSDMSQLRRIAVESYKGIVKGRLAILNLKTKRIKMIDSVLSHCERQNRISAIAEECENEKESEDMSEKYKQLSMAMVKKEMECEEKIAEIKSLYTQIQSKDSIINGMNGVIERMKGDCNGYQSEINGLKEANVNGNSVIVRMKSEMEAFKREMEGYKSEVSEGIMREETLEGTVERYKCVIDENEQKMEKLTHLNRDLKEKLQQSHIGLRESEQNRAFVKNKFEKLRNEKDKIQRETTDKCNRFDQNIDSFQKINNELQTQMQKLKSESGSKESIIASLKGELDTLNTYKLGSESRIKQIKQELFAKIEIINANKKEIKELRVYKSDYLSKEKEMKEMIQKLNECIKSKSALIEEREQTMNSANEEIVMKESEIKNKNDKIAVLNQEINDLKNKQSKLSALIQERERTMNDKNEEIVMKESEIKNKNEKIARLNQEINDLRNKQSQTNDEIGSFHECKSEMESQINLRNNQISDLETELANIELKHNKSMNNLNNAMKKQSNKFNKINNERNALRTQLNESKDWQRKYTQLTDTFTQQSNDKKELQMRYNTLCHTVTQFKTQIHGLKQELNSDKSNIIQQMTHIKKEIFSSANATVEALKNKLEIQSESENTLKDKLADFEIEISAKDNVINEWKLKCSEYDMSNLEIRDQMDTLQLRYDTLQSEMTHTKAFHDQSLKDADNEYLKQQKEINELCQLNSSLENKNKRLLTEQRSKCEQMKQLQQQLTTLKLQSLPPHSNHKSSRKRPRNEMENESENERETVTNPNKKRKITNNKAENDIDNDVSISNMDITEESSTKENSSSLEPRQLISDLMPGTPLHEIPETTVVQNKAYNKARSVTKKVKSSPALSHLSEGDDPLPKKLNTRLSSLRMSTKKQKKVKNRRKKNKKLQLKRTPAIQKTKAKIVPLISDTPMTKSGLRDLRCVDLRQKLKKHELREKGKKEELVNRLYNHKKEKSTNSKKESEEMKNISEEMNNECESSSEYVSESVSLDFEWIGKCIKMDDEGNKYFDGVTVNGAEYRTEMECYVVNEDGGAWMGHITSLFEGKDGTPYMNNLWYWQYCEIIKAVKNKELIQQRESEVFFSNGHSPDTNNLELIATDRQFKVFGSKKEMDLYRTNDAMSDVQTFFSEFYFNAKTKCVSARNNNESNKENRNNNRNNNKKVRARHRRKKRS